ncbi:phosphotransferase family protein [Demequina sp. NBRC 110056]|uniref:phosphotransferase family protein n=1 Tax=Demequina sp. NBRC 110056 TaxID=1570345 RepID=UPI000A004E1C|nr:phosphotransferase family protein [Demequina sp. NBRC 110056]
MTALLTTPDDVDVVRTRHDADPERPPLLVVDALTAYLDRRGLDGGDLAWRRIGDGQANVTYELRRGPHRVVLRRGPRPPFPPSAHDMVREARIVGTVGAHGVPAARVVAVCDDADVIGSPFYLMDFVDGHVVTDALPPGFDTGRARGELVLTAVDALAALHAVPLEGDVATLGRPEGYLERQIRRFRELWPLNTRRELPEMDRLATRLAATKPDATSGRAIVHGDYRIGNLMYAAPDRLAAILDWEMATLGDPLADLGYLLATYSDPAWPSTVMDLTPVTAGPGFPSREELAARYASRSSLPIDALAWYEALALWKAAVFCEAMLTRWRAGERPGDTFAPTLVEGVPALAAAAHDALDRNARSRS